MINFSIRVNTISLGCPKNRVDTERLLGALGPNMVPVDSAAEADLVLINTCGFILPAVEESLQTILDAAAEIADSSRDPKPVLAVAGCLVSRYGTDLIPDMPEVDLWLSTDELEQWPERVRKALGQAPDMSLGRRLSTGPAFAYLKVGEGCSHNCRFCTIPSIRGPHVSRPLDSLAAEAAFLVDQGVRELVVVGQDSTAYGSDLGLKNGLTQLTDRLAGLENLDWLRIMYLYPAGLTEELLAHLKSLGRPFLPYFDIPLQHAHPDVLKSMGRPFARDPRLVIDRVRKFFPEAALRTTFIVGYPGETDAMFQTLVDFVRETRFHHLGVFPYWAEEGTPAAEMADQVPEHIRTERRDIIMELQAGISRELLAEHVGETMDVLVENQSPEWDGLYQGRVWFQAPEVDGITYVSAPPETELQPGDLVRAEIEQAHDYDLSALA